MEMNQRQCGLSSLFQSSLLPLVQCKPKIHFLTPILTRENPWFHTSRSSLFEISLTAAVSSSTWLPSCPICPIGVWTSTKFWNSKNIQSAIFKKKHVRKITSFAWKSVVSPQCLLIRKARASAGRGPRECRCNKVSLGEAASLRGNFEGKITNHGTFIWDIGTE